MTLLGFLLMGTSVLLRAFVLQKLWAWYVTPEFGISVPSLLFFLGTALFATMFKRIEYDPNKEKDDSETTLAKGIAYVLVPLIVLCLGWLIHALLT